MMIDLYQFDRNTNIVDRGKHDCKTALMTFEQCYLRGFNKYECGEDALAETSFGLSKSETDFIEISCHGDKSVTVLSDRLCYPSWLSKIFSKKRSFSINGDKTKSIEIIQDYFRMERQAFENKYATYMCY